MFKLIVAGGREFTNYDYLSRCLIDLVEKGELKDEKVTLVSGMARGADLLAYQFSREQGAACIECPADWDTHGRSAGYIRNSHMADISDGLLAFWDGKSRGTQHMIEQAIKKGLKVWVKLYTVPGYWWNNHIRFDKNEWIWYDEAGLEGGRKPTYEEAMKAIKTYAVTFN